MGVTIQQIAEKTGVSKATVSRVLNGLAVKYETEQKIKAMMEKLQYRPHRFARGLANRQTGFLGVLTPSMDPFIAAIMAGMELEARKFGKLLTLGVIPESAEADEEREVVRTITEPPVVDGLLFFLPTQQSESLLRNLIRKKFPLVVLCERRYEHLASSVVIDNFDGAKQATRHLIQKGHKRIGFITGRPELSDSTERFEGYKQALSEAGITFDPSLVQAGRYTVQSGIEAASKFLSMPQPPTAVFAANDAMAIGFLKMLHERKKEGTIAVVGFDDIEMASLVSPSLTTVSYDLNELGRQAIHKLMRLVTGEEKTRSVLQLKANLVTRESA
ncbi:MAG TPA: LacI family DNA-binding transcriptional regulator [bacterium]|nr:LacI family DNA-binding transcriptional regulator [bacterium]